jgi:hypothetical protein
MGIARGYLSYRRILSADRVLHSAEGFIENGYFPNDRFEEAIVKHP